jgi:hypothetical protein
VRFPIIEPLGGALKRATLVVLATVAVMVVAAPARAQLGPPPVLPPLPTLPPLRESSPPDPADAPMAPADERETPAAEAPSSTIVDAAALEQRLAQSELLVKNSQPLVTIGGYVDIGYFVPGGNNGAGYVEDYGHLRFPAYGGFGWVFLGDILAPAVNSRGEVADLGNAPGVDRYDTINSGGAPGFIANEINVTLRSALTPTALVTASLNFTPRSGNNFSLGDVFDADLAQVEWLPTDSQRTSIFVGKTDSVLGIEYRDRKSDKRFGITPSLMARYTTGTALGVKVRSKFGDGDWLVLAAALTNGSNTIEMWHFYDEIDSNAGKTASGRLSVRLPLPFWLEFGASGSFGPQDRATDTAHPMWFVGGDMLAHLGGRVDLKAQYLRGSADGESAQGVYGLRLHGGGYLEADIMLSSSFGIIGRGEYRDALVWLGTERAYLTKGWRATGGLRWVMTTRAVLKAEYLHNGEYGGIPQIDDDVFTTSLVLSL